jgi:hypothetical protein
MIDCQSRSLAHASKFIEAWGRVDRLLPVHTAQLLTYLKRTNLQVGLLVNFNVPLLKHGIRRLTHQTHSDLPGSPTPREGSASHRHP